METVDARWKIGDPCLLNPKCVGREITSPRGMACRENHLKLVVRKHVYIPTQMSARCRLRRRLLLPYSCCSNNLHTMSWLLSLISTVTRCCCQQSDSSVGGFYRSLAADRRTPWVVGQCEKDTDGVSSMDAFMLTAVN